MSVSDKSSQKFWSHFYNQTSYLIDRKIKRDGNNFNVNPFQADAKNQLGLPLNLRNILFFNRGKQHYTTSYIYLSNKTRNVLSIGFVENSLKSHQFNFNHNIEKTWLVGLSSAFDSNQSASENFNSKNYNFNKQHYKPKPSYLFNDNSHFDVFYQYIYGAYTIESLFLKIKHINLFKNHNDVFYRFDIKFRLNSFKIICWFMVIFMICNTKI